jgi:hypothetical protein
MDDLTRVFSARVVVGFVVLGACGQQGGAPNGAGGNIDPGSVQPTTGPYQPLMIGATWTFHINDKGVEYDKTVAIAALEDLGGAKAGTMAYRSHSSIPTESQDTWYQAVGDLVVRHHERDFDASGAIMKSEEWYDPYRLRVDGSPEHLVPGATWTWTYSHTKTTSSKPTITRMITETWTIDGVDEPVAVPAGTFATLKMTPPIARPRHIGSCAA